MRLVPVLDILDGRAVHARRGERHRYAPLQSALAPDGCPRALAAALLARHPFEALYVADLDAIQGRGGCHDLIRALARQHTAIELWVDGGFASPAALAVYRDLPNVCFIIGTETLAGAADLAALRAAAGSERRLALSLDFQGERFIGPPALWQAPGSWPETVIAMNLDRIGAAAGPDFALLGTIRRHAPRCRLIAAGGVRDAADLARLATAGVDAVLLATALHDGRISAADCARWDGRRQVTPPE